jgi:hypothetical protein
VLQPKEIRRHCESGVDIQVKESVTLPCTIVIHHLNRKRSEQRVNGLSAETAVLNVE